MSAGARTETVLAKDLVELSHVGSVRNAVEVCVVDQVGKESWQTYRFGSPLQIQKGLRFFIENRERKKVRVELKLWKCKGLPKR